jgi:hypothetical protein
MRFEDRREEIAGGFVSHHPAWSAHCPIHCLIPPAPAQILIVVQHAVLGTTRRPAPRLAF